MLDPTTLPGAVSSWIHVDFIRELLPNDMQKIGWEGALVKVKMDYQGQELPPPEEGERSHPGLKQASRCF